MLLALIAMAVGAFQPFYLTGWRQDWSTVEAMLTELPFRKVPGLRSLCVEADRRIPAGARVLFAMPPDVSVEGYDYAFGRAHYLLAGKELVPRSQRSPGRIDYVLCWNRCAPPPGFALVWESREGSLARRTP